MSFLTVVNANCQFKTYFLSPDGDDSNSGLSIKEPWITIDKVNLFTFQPGDKILFQSDGVWYGQMNPRGSGEDGKPICIDSYGEGAKPVINIEEAEGAAIRLVNQSWWEVRNIEITSGAKPELGIGRQGIVALFEGNNSGIEHIVIENCFIHDVWGQMGGRSEYCGYNSAAIYVGTVLGRRGSRQNSYYDDILIQNNRIERVDKCGIVVYRGRNNVKVRKNSIDNLGGDGIFVNGPYKGLIEYNNVKRSCMRSGDPDLEGGEDFWPHTAAVWIQNCEETIMQFNQVYNTGRQPGNGDGNAYDFDFNCKYCILQYNYSRDNHGFLLIMYNTFGNIVRYNISENDQSHLIQLQGNIEDQNLIQNNVFYVDYGTIDLDYYCGDGSKEKTRLGAYFRNNIFYATGQGRFRTVYTAGPPIGRQFNDSVDLPASVEGTIYRHNCYFGPWLNGIPDDPEKMVADPLFVAPGSGGEGLSTLGGYKLEPESPCINAGIPMAFTEHDFYGNPLNDGSLDIGVYEQIGSGVFGDPKIQAELNQNEKARLDLLWARSQFPQRIVVPEEGGTVVVSLREPLSKTISGTINFSGQGTRVRPPSINIDNSARNDFTFEVRRVNNIKQLPKVIVLLKNSGLEEEFEIPVYSSERSSE